MSLKFFFNTFVSHGLSARLNAGEDFDGKKAWEDALSTIPSLSYDIQIPGGWVTNRTFNDGTTNSSPQDIYNYLFDHLNTKGENQEGYNHFLQTAILVKNDPCTIKKLAQVGFNVGQMLACIDFYSPEALQYIKTNKLQLVSSYINIVSEHSGGAIDPTIDIYKKFIGMTPYKSYKMIGGGCTCGQPGCDKCDCKIINLLI